MDIKAVYTTMMKRADLQSIYEEYTKPAPIPDQAATGRDPQTQKLTTRTMSPTGFKHYTYPMVMRNGRPQQPRIEEMGHPLAWGHKDVPRIMEYDAGKKQYQLHQYPYYDSKRALYPVSGRDQYEEANKLINDKNSLLSDETKKNYKAMGDQMDPSTVLQYNQYLKWRQATGGKTIPSSTK